MKKFNKDLVESHLLTITHTRFNNQNFTSFKKQAIYNAQITIEEKIKSLESVKDMLNESITKIILIDTEINLLKSYYTELEIKYNLLK